MARPAIAVFGSSEPRPGEPSYSVAHRVGEVLARAGHVVVTGGYGGVMEAASRGAHEAGGRTLGVLCGTFAQRQPNPYLSETVDACDLHERMRVLVERAQGYVVLPGRAGTLAELALLWALDRAGSLGHRPVILLGPEWRELVALLTRTDMLERSQREKTLVIDAPEELPELLR